MQRDLSEFEERIGYTFQQRDLLTRALTHKSYSHEARQDHIRDNETFEFLGDSVLGFVMGDVIYLGIGEEKSGGRKKESLLANLFEAMIAAVYLDGGIDAARALIGRCFALDLSRIDADDLLFHDYKTALQEAAQGKGLQLPEYNVVGEVGPDHDKRFIVEVKVGSFIARGEGSSKKEAQQQAAKHALAEFP